MKRILYIVLVAVLAMSAGTVWGQTNRTLGNIPDGWTVKVGETPVTVTNGTATIAAGATVVLTYTGPKYVNSIDLSRKSANDINLTNANKATAVSSFNSTTDSRLLFTEDISGSLTFTSSDGEVDMNGHTNNSNLDSYIQNNVEGKSITFKNGTVSASFDGASSWNDFYKGTVILENMTVNASIFTDGHAYIINGGTYNKIRHYKKTGTPGTLTIYDGKFSVFNDTDADNAAQSLGGDDCKGGAYILYGGKYKFNPSTTTLGREATITIPDGYSVQSNTDDDSGTYPWVVKSNSGIPANMYNLVGSQGNTVWTFTMPNYNVEMETNLLCTLGDIPTGWNVTADNVNFTASETNHEAHIPAGSTVTLAPTYPAKVKSVKLKDFSEIPLTFEAKTASAEVTFTASTTMTPTLQYSVDGGSSWTDYISGTPITLSSVGDKVSFRAQGTNGAFSNGDESSTFTCSEDCYIYGNIMSLLSKDNFATAMSVPDYAFMRLFVNNTKMLSHPSKALVLPATNLADSCYKDMFYGCKGLTTAPVLPATNLAKHCYDGMFISCTGLTTAPDLPATNLAKNCYMAMFHSCTSLTTAPDLPATTLAESCYENMFNGCTNLVTAPAISATTLAEGCCFNMFHGCTSLTTGPTLHAATLVNDCYQLMFSGCTNLNSVTCLATDIFTTGIIPNDCRYRWLEGVASTGTFTAHDENVGWPTNSEDGIPSGWTRENKHNIVNLASLTDHYVAQNNDILTGTLGDNYQISIADGATVTLDNVSINYPSGSYYESGFAGITCLGDANIILKDGTTNNVAAMDYRYPGIQVGPTGKTLTIQGTGTLNARYRDNNSLTSYGCGIGGGKDLSCGNIVINGGIINAVAFNKAAGIGSGWGFSQPVSCGTITINGGTVTATGGAYAAGIGTGYAEGGNNSCGAISINGGTVTATGGQNAAGIGTGDAYTYNYKTNTCASITIANTVTSVTATKGSSAPNSIGAGNNGTCGTVTIGGVEGAITESPYTYTPTPTPSVPSGAINGLFSVSSTKQVWFSQGNLQYTKSTITWSFMEHQYSTVETTGSYCTSDYGNRDVVSLFGWATSGYDHGATCYQPYSTNPNNENYYAYGKASYNLYDQTGQADWGYNAISNGGNTVNSGWRTLTTEEWQYLFANHTKGWSTVNGVNGYVIRPDGVSTAIAASYTTSAWETEEAAGAVFLPASGYRNSYVGTDVYDKGSIGRYWSSSIDGSSNAYNLYFSSSLLGPNYSMNRKYGESVRLVKDAD